MSRKTNATIVDFIYDAGKAFEERKQHNFKKEAEENLILPLRVITLLIAISGLFSMVFEVRYFAEFSVPVYFTRLSATVISFFILWILYSKHALKKPVLLVHVLLVTIIASSGYMILLMPSTLIVNSQIVGLMIFTSALFLSWDLKNQIIVAIYYNIVFASAILLNDKQIYFLPNMYESVLFVLFLSVISVIGSAVNFRLRADLSDKSFLVKLSERKYRSIFEHSAEGIFQSSPEGKFLTTNPALVKMLRYESEEELKNVDIQKDLYVKPSDRDRLIMLLQHKGEVSDYRLKLKRKDGTIITVRVSDRMVRDEIDDKKVYFEGSISDITEQVQLEDVQNRIQDELHQEKMKSENLAHEAVKSSEIKSQFLANMSHEIRTPINGIIGFLTLVESESYRNEEELKDFINNAKSSAESLLDLVNDILDFSKIEAGKMELEEVGFSMQKVVNDALAIVSPRTNEKNIRLVVNIDKHVPGILLGDSTRLRQIYLNLLSNAVKFTSKGEIKISVMSEKIAADKVKLTCSVKDSGVGIPPEKVAQLFKPFSQVDGSYTRKFGGTGLGLAICRELANMMNGSIWVESEIDKGSTFSFTCVLKYERQASFLDKLKSRVSVVPAPVPEVTAQLIRHADIKAARAQFKVLVAEDNLVNKKVVLRILEDAGLNAEAASNGLEAFQAVSANPRKYNLILMDVQMPEMDGFTATQKIRMIGPYNAKMPIIALTAHATAADREKCLAAGMSDYLTKPIKNQELISMLDKWLEIDYSVVREKLMAMQVKASQEKIPAEAAVPRISATKTVTIGSSQGNVQVAPPVVAPAVSAVEPSPPAAIAVQKQIEAISDTPPDVPEPLQPVVPVSLQPPAVVTDPDKVFDLEHFRSVSLDDPEFKVELLNTYLQDTMRRMAILDNHLAEQNAESIISEAHTIKGASYSLGAKLMGDQAKEIELAAKSGAFQDIGSMMTMLRANFEVFKNVVQSQMQ